MGGLSRGEAFERSERSLLRGGDHDSKVRENVSIGAVFQQQQVHKLPLDLYLLYLHVLLVHHWHHNIGLHALSHDLHCI